MSSVLTVEDDQLAETCATFSIERLLAGNQVWIAVEHAKDGRRARLILVIFLSLVDLDAGEFGFLIEGRQQPGNRLDAVGRRQLRDSCLRFGIPQLTRQSTDNRPPTQNQAGWPLPP